VSTRPLRRPARTPLLASTGLALALHGLLLAMAAPGWLAPGLQVGGNPAQPGPAAMQISLRQAGREVRAATVAAPEPAAAQPPEEPAPAPALAPASPAPLPHQALPDRLAGLPDGELLIPLPDLPLPEGALRLRLLLLLDASGMPIEILSEADPALATFAEASIHALERQRYQPALRAGQAQAGSLCLELAFSEGAPAAELKLLTTKGREDCLRAPSDS
jgi:hypothetical protein